MSRFQHILLLGPPASGKGTQGKRLSELLSLPKLGTGDVLRQAIEEGTELGKKAENYLSKGLYVPDSLIQTIVEKWVSHHQTGWIFDGFPRTIQQVQFIENSKYIVAPQLVLGFSVQVEELERRINSRRQCNSCDIVTNTFVSKGTECPDPNCDGRLYARNDDAIESFRVRYAQYEKHTAPLLDYYREMGILIEVNGEQQPDDVFENVKAAISGGLKNAV